MEFLRYVKTVDYVRARRSMNDRRRLHTCHWFVRKKRINQRQEKNKTKYEIVAIVNSRDNTPFCGAAIGFECYQTKRHELYFLGSSLLLAKSLLLASISFFTFLFFFPTFTMKNLWHLSVLYCVKVCVIIDIHEIKTNKISFWMLHRSLRHWIIHWIYL